VVLHLSGLILVVLNRFLRSDSSNVFWSRYVIQQLSPNSYTFKWEMMGDDGSWAALMEGKSTRAK